MLHFNFIQCHCTSIHIFYSPCTLCMFPYLTLKHCTHVSSLYASRENSFTEDTGRITVLISWKSVRRASKSLSVSSNWIHYILPQSPKINSQQSSLCSFQFDNHFEVSFIWFLRLLQHSQILKPLFLVSFCLVLNCTKAQSAFRVRVSSSRYAFHDLRNTVVAFLETAFTGGISNEFSCKHGSTMRSRATVSQQLH